MQPESVSAIERYGADATVKLAICGQPAMSPLPMASTPHEVNARGATAGSVAVVPAAAVGVLAGCAVAVACGVTVALAPGVAVGACAAFAEPLITGVHCPMRTQDASSLLTSAVNASPTRCMLNQTAARAFTL